MKTEEVRTDEMAVLPPPVTDLIQSHEHGAPEEKQCLSQESRNHNITQEKEDHQVEQDEVDSPCKTTLTRFDNLRIEDTQPFTVIPGYSIPSNLPYPAVTQTPRGYWVLDGQDLIDVAKNEGKAFINCSIEVIPEHSIEELALLKLTHRLKEGRGFVPYADLIRNTVCVDVLLRDRNMDAKGILSSRLGTSESEIDKMLSHAHYLNQYTLTFLAQRRVGKTFFEKAEAAKMRMVTRLTVAGTPFCLIMSEISFQMRSWCEQMERSSLLIQR